MTNNYYNKKPSLTVKMDATQAKFNVNIGGLSRTAEFRVSDERMLQWKYKDQFEWTDLFSLSTYDDVVVGVEPPLPEESTAIVWWDSTDGRPYIKFNGVWIDQSPAAVGIVAEGATIPDPVTELSFPASPEIGDFHTPDNGVTYQWMGNRWRSEPIVVIDRLDSDSAISPLSANQGMVLAGFIDNISNILQSNDPDLSTMQDVVDFINSLRNEFDSFVADTNQEFSDVLLAIATKANRTLTITAGNGMTGGGDLTANRTVTLGTPSTLTGATSNIVTATSHTHELDINQNDVGLDNVDNTSDADKPVSTAQQTALNLKANNATNMTAGNGLTGGGTLAADRTIALGTPSTLTGATTNAATATSHTHALNINKSDVGLSNVDNTSDANKPVSTAQQTALNLKANNATSVIAGNGLEGGGTLAANRTVTMGTPSAISISSTNAVTSTSHTHELVLSKGDIGLGNVDNTSDVNKPVSTATQTELDKKVDKVVGKGLSTEDYTTAEKTKLAGISAGSQPGTVTSVSGTGTVNGLTLSGTVTTTGQLVLGGTLTGVSLTSAVTGILPSANGGTNNAFVNIAGPASSVKTYTLPNANATILTTAAAVTVTQGGTGRATLTTGTYLKGAGTSAIGMQSGIPAADVNSGVLDIARIPDFDASKITTGVIDQSRLPSFVDDVMEFADLASFPDPGEPGKIYVAIDTNKTYRWGGSTYVYITSGAVDSVAGKTGVVTLVKSDVGLSNVDNTSDVNKPVSTAQQTALNLKANNATSVIAGNGLSGGGTLAADRTVTLGTPGALNSSTTNAVTATSHTHSITVTKSDVGLSNVDNTSDATKPVSTATQTALNGKVDNDDVRLTNAREWTAATVTQADAEAGISTTRTAWTALRIRQAIVAWWNGSSDKAKLDGIAAGAQVNTVTSVAGKTGAVTLVKADVGLSNVDNTSDAAKPVSTAQQTALNLKANNATTITAGNGLTGGGDLSTNRSVAMGTPSTISSSSTNSVTATSHTHELAVTKADVGLGAVDNTSDADKPVSTATQTALNLKANTAISITAGNGLSGGGTLAATRTVTLGTPGTITNSTTNSVTTTSHTHALTVTKADVGLGDVDNTSDEDKPVSTAQQIALDAKEKKSFRGTCTTAAGTVMKVITLDDIGYIPQDGDEFIVTFANANTATNPTFNINASGATPFRTPGGSAVLQTAWAAGNVVIPFKFLNGEYWAAAALTDTDTTYALISTAEIDAGTASTARSISGGRLEYALNKYKIDEDDMASDSDTHWPTQQSVKAYVDAAVEDVDMTAVVHKAGDNMQGDLDMHGTAVKYRNTGATEGFDVKYDSVSKSMVFNFVG